MTSSDWATKDFYAVLGVAKDAPAADIVTALHTVAAGGTYLSPEVSGRLFRGSEPRPVLTPRESEILSALGKGHSSKQIAKDLDLSVRTVEHHVAKIRQKMGASTRAEMLAALRTHLTS